MSSSVTEIPGAVSARTGCQQPDSGRTVCWRPATDVARDSVHWRSGFAPCRGVCHLAVTVTVDASPAPGRGRAGGRRDGGSAGLMTSLPRVGQVHGAVRTGMVTGRRCQPGWRRLRRSRRDARDPRPAPGRCGRARRQAVSAAPGSAPPRPGRTGWPSTSASTRGSRCRSQSADPMRAQVQGVRAGHGGCRGFGVDRGQQRTPQAGLCFGEMLDGACRAEAGCQRAELGGGNAVCGAGRGGGAGRLAGPAADMADQLEQVGAVGRRVVEAGAGAVTVGVQAAAAAGDDRAFLAGPAQPGESLLAGEDPRVLPDLVQGLAEDVEPGGRARRRRRSSANRPARSCRRSPPPPGRLAPSPSASVRLLTAAAGRDDRVECPDPDRPPVRLPAVEDGDQPVRVRGRAAAPGGLAAAHPRWHAAAGSRSAAGRGPVVPRRPRPGRWPRRSCRAARVQVPVPAPCAASRSRGAPGRSCCALGIPAVPVVRGPVAVDGDADLYAAVGEQVAECLVQQHAVGMDPQVELGTRRSMPPAASRQSAAAAPGRRAAAPRRAGRHAHRPADERSHARRCAAQSRRSSHRTSHRPAAPALVSALIDVTVIAGKIAAAMDLQDELTQRYSAGSCLGPEVR